MILFREKKELTESLRREGGVVLVLGDKGTGKTTLCEEIINYLTPFGIKCGYIDANISDNTIAGVGLLAMSVCTSPIDIKTLQPTEEYFIGSMTGRGHGIDIIFGISQMIRSAKKQNCQVILVDTQGEYDFPNSVILTQNEIEALYPNYLIGIQASHEIEFALCPFLKRNNLKIAILEKDPKAVNKHNLLEFGKKMSFNKLFKNSQTHLIMMSEVSFLNTWLGNGRQLKWQYFHTLSNILKAEVLHVEIAYKTLFIFSNAVVNDTKISEIKEFLHVENIVIQSPEAYNNLYVGLRNSEKKHLGVGLIQNILFKHNSMMIKSNIVSVEPVKEIKFGFIKTTPTGDFITQL
ncbi:MAG: hypothetical protein IJS60_07395 [Abditibacteriota bacterium]|nr:hypothetical protein [Abditibacteriota bacterium]